MRPEVEKRQNEMLAHAIASRTEASIQAHAFGRNKSENQKRAERAELRAIVIERLINNHKRENGPTPLTENPTPARAENPTPARAENPAPATEGETE